MNYKQQGLLQVVSTLLSIPPAEHVLKDVEPWLIGNGTCGGLDYQLGGGDGKLESHG